MRELLRISGKPVLSLHDTFETMKRIAALTMVRSDNDFLRKWVEYYSAAFGPDNLYVWFDGLDQTVPDFCSDVHTARIEHVSADVHVGDRRRAAFLSERASELFSDGYELVVGTDVDEFLVVDPSLGLSLAEFLSSVRTSLPSISGLGVDVGQRLPQEGRIDWSSPFLTQRSYAKLSTRYSKATVLCRPVAWGSGFHRTRRGNFHIVKDLFLFHFGCVDIDRIKSKMSDSDLTQEGWSRHLAKRAGTIRLVSGHRAHGWERSVSMARRVQNMVRPPYAWNKPAMFELRLVVKIPSRFCSVV